jgi:hypothetical protein
MKKVTGEMGSKSITENIAAWVRGLVWTAMVLGCAWASAQSYLVVPPGRYTVVSMAGGSGMSAAAAEGAQNTDTAKDDLFNGTDVFAKNATHVTEISMDPDSLGLVGGPEEHKAHNMVLNVVRTYEYDKPGMYNMADVDAFRNKLNTGDWHCSVHERDLKTGESTDVCSKHRTDGLREQAIVTVEPRELTFIHRIWRGNGPGSSELGFFPMVHGLGPMTMMAMTNPEAFADMEMGMHGLVLNLQPDVMVQLKDLKVRPFNEKQLKDLNEQFKNLKVKPFDEKQMKELNERMKELKVIPPEMPVMPAPGETPQAPSAPEPPSAAPPPTAPSAPQPE